MITEQEYQDLLLKNAKEYQRACELQRENNKLKDELKDKENECEDLKIRLENIKTELKNSDLTCVIANTHNIYPKSDKDTLSDVSIPEIKQMYVLYYKNKPLKQWEKEHNHLVDVNKTLERKLKIAEEALFFISICVKIIKGYSSPIPTREACKAYAALQKMEEVENDK